MLDTAAQIDQALAGREVKKLPTLRGRTVAYVGDGNNVCRSLGLAGALAVAVSMGCVATPGPQKEVPPDALAQAEPRHAPHLVGSVDGRTGHHVGWRAAPRGLGRQVDGSRQVLAVGRTER